MLELLNYFKNHEIIDIRFNRYDKRLLFKTNRFIAPTEFSMGLKYLRKFISYYYKFINECVDYV